MDANKGEEGVDLCSSDWSRDCGTFIRGSVLKREVKAGKGEEARNREWTEPFG